MGWSYFDASRIPLNDWASICPPNEYRVTPAGLLAPLFARLLTAKGAPPIGLVADLNNVQKYPSVFMMASGSHDGNLYYMANINRVDNKAGAIDGMPFGLVYASQVAVGSGALWQHADYLDRSIPIPHDFLTRIGSAAFGTYYPLTTLPPKDKGSISELLPGAQTDAFSHLVTKIKNEFGI